MRFRSKELTAAGMVIALASPAVIAKAEDAAKTEDTAKQGNDKGNGGFAYQRARALLEKAANGLADELDSAPDHLFTPINGEKSRLRRYVSYESLVQKPDKRHYRQSQLLDLDYDLAKDAVVLLEPFYQAFSAIPLGLEAGAIRLIKRKLVHEAAHLFGLNETQAESFSKSVMEAVDPDERSAYFFFSCTYEQYFLHSVKLNNQEVLPERQLLRYEPGKKNGYLLPLGKIPRGKPMRITWVPSIWFSNGEATRHCRTQYAVEGKVPGGSPLKDQQGIFDFTAFDLAPIQLIKGGGYQGSDFILLE